MPWKPPRPCSHVGCGALTHERYCPQHTREHRRREDQRRGSAASRGLDRRWRKTRAALLRTEPLCRPCRARGRTTAASEVDHIVPRAAGGGNERENLQPICEDCHKAKTAEDLRRYGPRA